jgi:putative ABC transport system permease protein
MLLDEPDLGLGKELVLKIKGEEHSFKIVGICIGMSASLNMIYANYPYVAKIANQTGEADTLMVRFAAHDPASVEAGSNALEDHFERMGIRVNTLNDMISEKEDAEALFEAIVALLLVMAVLLALVGGLGLMGTMSINVLERTREIGVMRAIGASNPDIQGIVIVEGMVIGLISWVLSILLSFPITGVLTFGVGAAIMQAPMPAAYDMSGILAWLIGILFIGTVASALPAHRASRLTVRDTLAYE